jgi:signal transduction histidine kinase
VSLLIYGIGVSRRLCSPAGAVERARGVCEEHEGVIQSLISLKTYVDVVRRRPEAQETAWPRELSAIQSLLRGEIFSLRKLMRQLKPWDLAPQQFLEFLGFRVEKFRRETNSTASFVSSLGGPTLAPRVCSELARIVPEALVNVQKRSRTQPVGVRFEPAGRGWKLVVDDDGRGFDFSGRLTHAELDSARKGPVVIRERVRVIGGELARESLAGRGARLEMPVAC